MSSIYQRNKTWWYKGKNAIGTTIQKSLKTSSKIEAKKLQKKIDDGANGTKRAGELTIQELYDTWKTYMITTDSARQANDNANMLKVFIDWSNIRDLENLNVPLLQGFKVYLIDKLNLTDKTSKNYLSAISAFCDWLICRGDAVANPCLLMRTKSKKVANKQKPPYLKKEEISQLFEIAEDHSDILHRAVVFGIYTGMRAGEMRFSRWEWIDWTDSNPRISIPFDIRKTADLGNSIIPMHSELIKHLEPIKKKSGYIFAKGDGDHYSKWWWNDLMNPIRLAMPQFTEGKSERQTGRGWHLLRHTTASQLVQAGVPLEKVRDILGHTSITTTMRYAHLDPNKNYQSEISMLDF